MPTAYTLATVKPATTYAASSMWIASYQKASLKNTCQTWTSTTLPLRIVIPLGVFIQLFAATTEKVPPTPDSTTGRPLQKCTHGDSRCQP
jgi:hypothetical protein